MNTGPNAEGPPEPQGLRGRPERWMPADLEQGLRTFRGRLRRRKGVEAAALGVGVVVLSFAAVFASDRLLDTPRFVRGVLGGAVIAALVVLGVSWAWRWVRRSRTLPQIARVVGRAKPMVGDRLLGVVELAERGRDGQSSEALAKAAIAQVSEEMRHVDWDSCVPEPKDRSRAKKAVFALVAAAALVAVPGAGWNALLRFAMPWKDVPRYTFAQVADFAPRRVVAMGESFELRFSLAEDSAYRPGSASLDLGGGRRLHAERDAADEYRFSLPPLVETTTLSLRVGDDRETLEVLPLARPELAELSAKVELPSYLERGPQSKDVRGGSLTVLEGSRVSLSARISRELAEARRNGSPSGVTVDGAELGLDAVRVDADSTQVLEWVDQEGLASRQPFEIELHAREDGVPQVNVRGLNAEQVVLDEETITFTVDAVDDYGLRSVGIEWQGVATEEFLAPAKGDRTVMLGGPEAETLHGDAAFCAQALGIAPQPIELRVYTQDYRPGAPRVYSSAFRLYVLDAEQHMIWLTEQLRRWHQDVLEVRDEEERLHAQNLEMRGWPADRIASEEGRRELSRQAASERANGRRLEALTSNGEELVQQAVRNPEFNVNTLETLAKALASLRNLAQNRMPSVGQMIAQASQKPSGANSPPPAAPQVSDQIEGANRDAQEAQDGKPTPPDDSEKKPSGRLGLPTSTIAGGPSPPKDGSGACPPPGESPLDPALDEQAALLAEFHKVMDEIGQLLNDLHASTFVKRLKHVARQERQVGKALHDQMLVSFGVETKRLGDGDRSLLDQLSHKQRTASEDLQNIEEDLVAYFQRTREEKFDTVSSEMHEQSAVSVLGDMSDAIVANFGGTTVAEADYWTDELDRWAEILVGPG